MPHSSGGGGRGGMHAGSGGSGFHADIRNRSYAGSVHYVYYGKNGESRDLYAGADMENMKKPDPVLHGIGLALLLCTALWCLVLFIQQFTFPHRIDPASYGSVIVIEDRTGAVDENALRGVLSDFRDLTGVTPSVEVLYDADLPQFYNMQGFARLEYVRLFDDEKHWLFVISFPDDESVCSQWEGMIGDNTGGVIGAVSERSFTYILQRKLSAAKPADLNGALAEAFAEFSESVMRPHADGGSGGLFLVLLMLLCSTEKLIRDYRRKSMLYMAKRVPEGKEKKPCLKCGCGYYPGTVRRCPWCGERTEEK